ncbi:hypothetical protein TNCV_1039761 [Trichonephila clavipes]|nr:hypothetical protein TNCV_1039761 [Trichonephila clavipes]
MSPVWCSRSKPTTGVLLAPCHDEFSRPRFDYVRQVVLQQVFNITTRSRSGRPDSGAERNSLRSERDSFHVPNPPGRYRGSSDEV